MNPMSTAVLRVMRLALLPLGIVLATFCSAAVQTTDSTPLASDDGGRYTATVSLNGAGPFHFIVDTGAQGSDVSGKVAWQVNPRRGSDMKLIGASGDQQSVQIVFEDFDSDLFHRHDVSMIVLPNSSVSDADGVLGMDVFASGRIEFGFADRQLRFTASGPAPAGFVEHPGSLRRGSFMVVDVVLDGVHANAVIDTGGKQTVANPQLLAALGYKVGDARLVPDDSINGVTMQQTPAMKTTLGNLAVGHTVFSNPKVTFADLSIFHVLGLDGGPAMIIGIDQLSQLRAMAIDYPRAALQLQP
jgi:predicted aspartyl protease